MNQWKGICLKTVTKLLNFRGRIVRIEQVDIGGSICMVVKEVYDGLILETSEGNRIAVCMRDDTFEVVILGDPGVEDRIHRVDMKNGNIYPLGAGKVQTYLFDPKGMRAVDENGQWVKVGVHECKHPDAKYVGDAHVYECECGQRMTRGFTEKEDG